MLVVQRYYVHINAEQANTEQANTEQAKPNRQANSSDQNLEVMYERSIMDQ